LSLGHPLDRFLFGSHVSLACFGIDVRHDAGVVPA